MSKVTESSDDFISVSWGDIVLLPFTTYYQSSVLMSFAIKLASVLAYHIMSYIRAHAFRLLYYCLAFL